MPRPAWHEQGACHDQGLPLFFPVDDETASARTLREKKAKEWCSTCTVRLLCRDYALETGQASGIWGGLTDKERARIRLSRRVAASPVASKACRECGETKPVEGFGISRNHADGLNSVCKECVAAAMRVQRQQRGAS